MSDLARQLAAHPRFRWAPGMLDTRGNRVVGVTADGGPWWLLAAEYTSGGERVASVPDLTDPATAGVLLSWLPPGVFVRQSDPLGDPDVWSVGTTTSTGWGRSLGEAAAKAVLAVWEVSDAE
jgi:hypothetical protein